MPEVRWRHESYGRETNQTPKRVCSLVWAVYWVQAEAVALRIPLRLLSALRHQQADPASAGSSMEAEDASSAHSQHAAPTAHAEASPGDDTAGQIIASTALDVDPEAAMAVLSGERCDLHDQ